LNTAKDNKKLNDSVTSQEGGTATNTTSTSIIQENSGNNSGSNVSGQLQ